MMGQSYSQNGQKSNIFNDISSSLRNRAGKMSENEINRVASMRTDKSSADEAKIFLYILIFACTAVTTFLAYTYYYDVFKSTMTPDVGFVLSALLAAAVEIGKIKLFAKASRSILFGWIVQDWPSFGYWGFVLALSVGSFLWSVQVSTKGLSRYSAQHADETLAKEDLPAMIAAYTAQVDGMIANESKARDAATSNRWKGNIVQSSSKSAAKSSATIENLMKQRAQLVDQVTAEYRENKDKRTDKIGAFAYFINQFGGYMEGVCLFCLLGIAFADWKLVSLARKTGQVPTEPPPHPTEENRPNTNRDNSNPRNETRTANNANQFQNIHDLSKRTPLFSPEEIQAAKDRKTVSQSEKTVSQCDTGKTGQNAIGPDQILDSTRTKISREVSNLRKGNGTVNSIVVRINEQLGITCSAFQNPDNAPTQKAGLAFQDVLDKAVYLREEGGLPRFEKEQYLQIALWDLLNKNVVYTLNDYYQETRQNMAA